MDEILTFNQSFHHKKTLMDEVCQLITQQSALQSKYGHLWLQKLSWGQPKMLRLKFQSGSRNQRMASTFYIQSMVAIGFHTVGGTSLLPSAASFSSLFLWLAPFCNVHFVRINSSENRADDYNVSAWTLYFPLLLSSFSSMYSDSRMLSSLRGTT